jgi:hypothetical protein
LVDFAANARPDIKVGIDVATKRGDPMGKGAAMRAKIAEVQGKPKPDLLWIDPTLSKEQKQHLKETEFDIDALDDAMADVADEGLRVSVHLDERDGCYVCRFWPSEADTARARMVLVGRGTTPTKAVKQAYYKHDVLLVKDWSKAVQVRPVETLDD